MKRLARVVRGLVCEAQTCAISGRSIQGNLHLIRYYLERVEQNSGKGGARVHVDQYKAFSRVDHVYLAAVLEAVALDSNLRRWIALM